MNKISDVLALSKSVVLMSNKSILVNSAKIIEWRCVNGCKGVWKESVAKRAKYMLCPMCQPAAGRTAKVTKVSLFSFAPKDALEFVCDAMENMSVSEECKHTLKTHCSFCSHEWCVDCLKKYIISGVGVARCSCNKSFTTTFLVNTFGCPWFNEVYLPFLRHIQLERERAMIPSTRGLVELLNRQKREACELGNVCNAIRAFRDSHPNTPIPDDLKDTRNKLHDAFNLSLELSNAYPHDQPIFKGQGDRVKSCPTCHDPVEIVNDCTVAWCGTCLIVFNDDRMDNGETHNPYTNEIAQPLNVYSRHMIDSILCKSVGKGACDVFNRILAIRYVLPSNPFTHRHINSLYRLRAEYMTGELTKEEWEKHIISSYDELYISQIDANINEAMCVMLTKKCNEFTQFMVTHQDTEIQSQYILFTMDVNAIRMHFNTIRRQEHIFSKVRVVGDGWYLE